MKEGGNERTGKRRQASRDEETGRWDKMTEKKVE